MPGEGSWKTLYQAERTQLIEEGYPVRCRPPAGEAPAERDWERAYRRLWKVRERGLRPDFAYVEPEDFEGILADAEPVPTLARLSDAEYAERVGGAWYGRCAGLVLGKPLEVGWNRLEIREYLESVDAYPLDDWVPIRSEVPGRTLPMGCLPSSRGHVRFVQPDDDIHYTILSLLLAEAKGLDFTKADVGWSLLDNVPYHFLWFAERQVYYHMVNLTADRSVEEQVAEFPLRLNPYRECIAGQLKADLWGYLTPSDPRAGARYIHRMCSLNLVKNGIYGGMLVSGCISAALSPSPSVETIIAGGLSCIPRRSRLAEAVRNVQRWYAETNDWTVTCDRIYDCYGHMYFAGTTNNVAIVVLAALHGQLDFTRTITTAVLCGIDTDCNGATAGSICGAAIGYESLDQRWIAPLKDTVKTAVAGFGEGRISDLVQRTVACRRATRGR